MPPETDLSNSASMEDLDVSRETWDLLRTFETLFRKRNAVMNLASKGAMETFWERHILDSVQIQALAPERLQWLDLGSGGGLPGIVTAILLKDRPDAMVHLVESVGKKAAFLQEIVDELDLPARIYNDRIENVTISPAPEAISARALAPLDRLFAYVAPWFSDGVTGYFHKGRGYRREIAELSPHWRYDLTVHPSKTDDEAAILQIDRLRRTGDQERSR